MTKRPYSLKYPLDPNEPRIQRNIDIPAWLDRKVKAKAKQEHISFRALVLSLLEAWVK